MDVQLVRELLQDPQRVKEHMEGFSYSLPAKLSTKPEDLSLWVKTLSMTPTKTGKNQAEYEEANKILQYNASTGNLKGYYCEKCHNRGNYLDIDDYGNEILRNCSCLKRRDALRNIAKSGMGDLLDKKLSTFVAAEDWQKTMKEMAQKYAKSDKDHWFGLFGQSGCGKTHICAALGNWMLRKGYKVLYMQWVQEVKSLKRMATDPEYNRIFSRWSTAPVLYIDDLFKGKVTEADINIAYELINYRYNNRDKVTLISSELDLEQLSAVDGAIAGRIKERCGEYFLQIPKDQNKNWRLKI